MAGNGGSLEDCYTNVFSLTDLTSIKFRKFVTQSGAPRGVQLSNDPVLTAFGKCLRAHILCTWRRTPLPMSSTPEPLPLPTSSLTNLNSTSKELWVFWFQDDPPELAEFTKDLDSERDELSTDSMCMSYEIRCLLFKAIHMHLEKQYFKSGIRRFGRWFTVPLKQLPQGRESLIVSYIIAFEMHFCVQGGNTVCTFIGGQRQPPLFRLTRKHLECGLRLEAVLGPMSMRGVLLPQSEMDMRNQIDSDRQYEQWKEYCPLGEIWEEEEDMNAKEPGVPKMVLLEIDGIRMFWPSCYVCFTMEEDQKANRGKFATNNSRSVQKLVPDELITPNGLVRNKLLVSTLRGRMNLQSVLQTALLPRRPPPPAPPPPISGFQTPAPPLTEEELKWNCIDPARIERCPCPVCNFLRPLGFMGADMDAIVEGCLLAPAMRLLNPAFPNQMRMHPLFITLRRHETTGSSFLYHLRILRPDPVRPEDSVAPSVLAILATQDAAGELEESAPPVVQDDWISDEKAILFTDMYFNQERAMYYYDGFDDDAEPLCEDDFMATCSPFTPVKVVSPCETCPWPSIGSDGPPLPEQTFNEIFTRGAHSTVPPTASQAERARDYECYFNPLLLDRSNYQSYHSRRQGEPRRRAYPITIRMPPSPDQPGSQETIPATSSPLLDLEDRKRPLDMESMISMTKTVEADWEEAHDQVVKDTYLMRKRLRTKLEWPRRDTSLNNVAFIAGDFGEDFRLRIRPFTGKAIMIGEHESGSEEEESTCTIMEIEDANEFGEGPSGVCVPYPDPCSVPPPSDDFMGTMDVDLMILSPPASTEGVDTYSSGQTTTGSRHRMGPPSVEDAPFNHIYPTPPSANSEAQQFSPAPAPLSVTLAPVKKIEEDEEKDEPMEVDSPVHIEPRIIDMNKLNEEKQFAVMLPELSKLRRYRRKVTKKPLSFMKRKWDIPAAPRYSSSIEQNTKLRKLMSGERKPRCNMPPDYQKLQQYMERQHPKSRQMSSDCLMPVNPTTPSAATYAPSVTTANNMFQMAPVAVFANPNHKPFFDSEVVLQQMHQHSQMGFNQANAMRNQQLQRQVSMQNMQPHPMGGMPPQYGQQGPYNVPTGMQPTGGNFMGPQNSVQQLHNLVNTVNASGGYGQPQNMMGMGGMPMGAQYNNQHQMMPPPQYNAAMAPQFGMDGPSTSMGPPGGQYQQNQMHPYGQMRHHHEMQMRGGSHGNMHPHHQQQPPMYNMVAGSDHQQQATHQMGYGNQHQQHQMGGPIGAALMNRETVDGHSLVLALMMQDTILDLHYDSVFDACPICSCNSSIRGRELGVYISAADVLRKSAQEQQQMIGEWSGFALSKNQYNNCTCGFSAVRHRYLSFSAGLFTEDSREATACVVPISSMNMGGEGLQAASQITWFDPAVISDVHMLEQIRMLSQQHWVGRMVNQLASFSEGMSRVLKPQSADMFNISSNSEYVISQMYNMELILIGHVGTEMSLVSGSRTTQSGAFDQKAQPKFLQFFHQWGLQHANEVRELRDTEYKGLLEELSPILEKSMQIIRKVQTPVVEGPLTWKSFHGKREIRPGTAQAEDDKYLAEPLPMVMIATEKEAIKAAPQIIRMWEHLSLGPIDQPKDVLYLTVIPDGAEVHEKTCKYMDTLSQLYERLRLGRHIPFVTADNRDGCLRLSPGAVRSADRKFPMSQSNTFNFINSAGRIIDSKSPFLQRLKMYVQQLEEHLSVILTENDKMFERSEYRTQLAYDTKLKRAAAVALAQATEKLFEERQSAAGAGAGGIGQRSGGTPAAMDPANNALQDLLLDTQAQVSGMPGPPSQAPSTSVQQAPQQPIKEELPQLENEDIPTDEYGTLPHVIVIYLVNPFAWGADSRTALYARVAALALIRAFNVVSMRLTPRRRSMLQLEMIGYEQIADITMCMPDFTNDEVRVNSEIVNTSGNERELSGGYLSSDSLKETALAVYTQPRLLMADCIKSIQPRFMTKFGPLAPLYEKIEEMDKDAMPQFYKTPSCGYHLAPPPFPTFKVMPESGKLLVTNIDDQQTLYVSYCLIGSDYLAGTVTDSLGKLLDNVLINIKTKYEPTNFKYQNKTQILDAIGRLWTFVMGVLASDMKNWRLVVGRLGRIGHGELRAWTCLLNKTSLRRFSARLKESCSACCQMPACYGYPSILSACLVSTEPEPYLRVMPSWNYSTDLSKKKERQLITPDDVSCTHIMVFPCSADIQLGQQADQQAEGENWDFDDLQLDEDQELLDGLNLDQTEMEPQPSAGFRAVGAHSFFPDGGADSSVENQPLATGFYVSTAPAVDLPDWFWSSCPSSRNSCPVHLKSSLHINVQQINSEDDFKGNTGGADKNQTDTGHPLESPRTDDVLRHVLETYNALSWLSINPVTGERRSCLPVHIQHLLRLYQSVTRMVIQ